MEEKTKSIDLIKAKVIYDTETLLTFLKDSGWLFTDINMLTRVIKCCRKMISLDGKTDVKNLELELCYGEGKESYILIHGDTVTCMTAEECMTFSILKQFDFSEVAGLLVRKR